MILYIVRHAWAGHYGDPQWPDDFQRPLSEEGRRRFAQVVAELAGRGFRPEVVVTSPLVRCRQTAETIAEQLAGKPEVVEHDGLLPGNSLKSILQWTARRSDRYGEIAWVGHAPDVGRMTAELIGAPDGWIRFGKGSVAAVRFHESPSAGEGELRWLVTAKVLGC